MTPNKQILILKIFFLFFHSLTESKILTKSTLLSINLGSVEALNLNLFLKDNYLYTTI